MIACTRHTLETTGRSARRWVACACLVALFALVGCKSDKPDPTPGGSGVSRGKDPLVYGPTKIPRQDLPIPVEDPGPATWVRPGGWLRPALGRLAFTSRGSPAFGGELHGPWPAGGHGVTAGLSRR